jgi:phage shock protein E
MARERKLGVKKFNRQSLVAILLIVLGAVIILGSYFWFQIASQRDEPETAAVEEKVSDIPYPDIKRVGLADAKAAFDLGTAVFIDVRDEYSFQQGHIPNARSIPVDTILQESSQLDPSQWYILYCT